eukprot:CAMPEP_0194307926 /NCGR_PEP_ID=MMETSP0171-20130528/4845_1 /TAXON_ID=218684 /ORGANISM="Corethron pennatum, Strain L29A3" /LENGTH=66 /DNA_ID=CAMNT_0039060255 /DNA_START=304 /DNA_END=504 /DNA_ORIENTATION=+
MSTTTTQHLAYHSCCDQPEPVHGPAPKAVDPAEVGARLLRKVPSWSGVIPSLVSAYASASAPAAVR